MKPFNFNRMGHERSSVLEHDQNIARGRSIAAMAGAITRQELLNSDSDGPGVVRANMSSEIRDNARIEAGRISNQQ